MRLLITGVTGLLGVNLAWEALRAGYEVVGVAGSRDLPHAPFPVLRADLSQPGALAAVWQRARPDAVVHAAALAQVDACERQPDLAERLNARLPGEGARLAARHGVPFVHISTDAVFDGQRGDYTEDDPPHPLSTYARTKRAGERAVLQAYPQAAVLRVNFFGWSLSGTRSLAEWFLNNLQAGREMLGFTDVFFCPLLANHLAEVILAVVARGLGGLFHATGSGCLSKYAFGVALARRFGYEAARIRPASVAEAGLTARRAPRLTLRNEKLARALGRPLPDWRQGLEAFWQQAQAGYPQRLRAWASQEQTT